MTLQNELLAYASTSYPGMLSIAPGWETLIRAAHERILAVDPDYKIDQIKEKFGGLRFYITSNSEAAHEIAGTAERASYHICDECGALGELLDRNSWLMVRCPEHAPEGAVPTRSIEAQQDDLFDLFKPKE